MKKTSSPKWRKWLMVIPVILVSGSLILNRSVSKKDNLSRKTFSEARALEDSLFSVRSLDNEIFFLEKELQRGTRTIGAGGESSFNISEKIIGIFKENKIAVTSYNIGSEENRKDFSAQGYGSLRNSLHLLYDLSLKEKDFNITYFYLDPVRISLRAAYE